MYVLSVEEIFEALDQIITSMEVSDESTFGIVIELAYQMKDELRVVVAD